MSCWIPIVLGVVMHVAGLILLVRFFVARRTPDLEHRSLASNEFMVLGALMACVGPLLIFLGGFATICDRVGIGW